VNPQEIHLIRKNFAEVERQAHVAALVFYRRLFTLEPRLRPLFKTDIEEQSRKLIEMLAAAVSLLEKPEALTAELETLGARHVNYGVQEAHYAIVGQALLGMLEEVLGDQFDAEAREVWTKLYGFIATAMQRGAAQVK
jgi:hemoglobin-like flavoprotein